MIKRIIYIALLPVFVAVSCLFEDGNAFDTPAAERITEAIKLQNNLLSSAPYGWKMEYYSLDLGGYVFLCKFDNLSGSSGGTVTLASDAAPRGYPIGTREGSSYDIIFDQSVVLSFNTFNPLLHHFTRPLGNNVNGRRGDHEFVILRASADSIIMQGKRHKARVVMTPFNSDDWTAYLLSINASIRSHEHCHTFNMQTSAGTIAAIIDTDIRQAEFTLPDRTVVNRYFVPTTTGIKLQHPFSFGDVTIDMLDWNNSPSPGKFVERTNSSAELIGYLPLRYLPIEFFEGYWVFTYQTLSMFGGGLTAGRIERRNVLLTRVGNTNVMEVSGFWKDTHNQDRKFNILYRPAIGSLAIAGGPVEEGSPIYMLPLYLEFEDGEIEREAIHISEGDIIGQVGQWASGSQTNPNIVFNSTRNFPTPINGWVMVDLDEQSVLMEQVADVIFMNLIITKQ